MTTTTYTIRNHWGMELFETTDTDEAQFFAERGATVTAVTEGSP